MNNYFHGKDGFIWWHGVVEDRKDPLFLGRCRVRILGWHTADKSELPTINLPWAFPIMPITSASQSGAGEAPVGPVEGTWVMGYYRDGELAQEPVMMGTMHGIPENYAKLNTGFNDSRLDVVDGDRHSISIQGGAKSGGGSISLMGWPYPPKKLSFKEGKEVEIEEYTNEERLAGTSKHGQGLYPRRKNEPTTSRYARGEEDSSAKTDTEGIIASKNRNLSTGSITSEFAPSENLRKNVPTMTGPPFAKLINVDLFTVQQKTQLNQPPSPYAAVYPFNHVYESESGHLIEIDDTPTKERLHWYHRSGSFTEFHPKGIRTDNTASHHYNIVTGDQESIIGGTEKKLVPNGNSFTKVGKSKHIVLGQDFVVTTDGGDIILGAPVGHVVLSGQTTVIDAKNTLMLNAPTIVRSNGAAVDVFKGSQTISAQGAFNLQSAGLTLGSAGAATITTFGSMTQTVGGISEETIANLPVPAATAKSIKTATGKIVLEAFEPITGGIDLNVGPLGLAGKVSVGSLGDIVIKSLTGPTGISIEATTAAKLKGIVQAAIEGALIDIKADAAVQIDGKLITVGGQSEPMILGKTFLMDIFKDHQHPSSVGPTGPIMPQYAAKLLKAMSKKCFLG
jgi:hypothetical protein